MRMVACFPEGKQHLILVLIITKEKRAISEKFARDSRDSSAKFARD